MPKVLFIDDEVNKWMVHLKSGLARHGFEVVGEEFPEKALKRIKEEKPDVVLLDIWYHNEDKGGPTLALIRGRYPDLPVIMITTSLLDAREIDPGDYPGASYFFAKEEIDPQKYEDPYEELDRQLQKSIDEVTAGKKTLDERMGFIVGKTPRMIGVAEQILQVAPSDVTVLIRGESGTGKELVARALHQNSQRSSRLFYTSSITVIPSRDAGLALMDKLFGHARRQPPWNDNGNPGIFENASGGTVFLDEIGNASQDIQEDLLRVLQERTVERIGSHTPIRVDVRIITATNQNLEEKIKNGTFREDLYYRLKVVEISLPSFRERISDIPILYAHFVEKFNLKHNKQISAKPQANVLRLFQGYSWPGNIRQFENVIEEAIVKARSNVLTPSSFNLRTDSDSGQFLPINFAEVAVGNLINGKTSWDVLQDVHGESRTKILHVLIERLKAQNGKRPSSRELANVLGVTETNMRRILVSAGIRLKDL